MKNTLTIIFLSGLFFSACKKDRVCECTVTTSSTTSTRTQLPGFPPLLPETDTTFVSSAITTMIEKTTYQDVSKKKAKFNCVDKEETFSNSAPTSIPGIFTINTTTTGKRTYVCSIE